MSVRQLIFNEQWNKAFELVKDEVHQMTNEGAELVTELVKKTKWYEHGLALLKLQKDFSPIYMNQYLKVCRL
jgi:hypothetical protein